MYLVHGALVCTNSSSHMLQELATMILQNSDRRRSPWPKKLLKWVLHQLKSIMVVRLRYTIQAYTQAVQTLYAFIMAWRVLLTSNKVIVRRRKNGSKIIICRSQRTPWHTTTFYGSAIRQGVIMVCTPDLYYQEFRITDHELRGFKHKFLKRLDMYHDLMFDEKEQVTLGDLNVLLTEMTKEKK